nr:nucleotide-binding alpha-beta plait domain-containing protein [Tanacetum cinerariifolium]
MGSYRSKEDDVARISTSIYVTNFPNSFSAKDLFYLCKQYGHVVDSFIPIKRSKNGKRFCFVRFINVFNEERKDEGGFMGKNSHMYKKDNGNSVAKEPTGRVKEFASLANLKVALCNEGFVNIKIKYMGELWVLLEFVTRESIKLFRDNVSVGSWFLQIIKASRDFVTNERIAWVEVEGVERVNTIYEANEGSSGIRVNGISKANSVESEVTYETLGDLVHRFHDHTQAIPVHRIQTTEGIQRKQGRRIVGVESAVITLTERVAELERDYQRLRGTASVESQRVDRLQRGMSRMQREMRQM